MLLTYNELCELVDAGAIDGDSEAWWRAAVDEADLLLTRFAMPTVQQESDHYGVP